MQCTRHKAHHCKFPYICFTSPLLRRKNLFSIYSCASRDKYRSVSNDLCNTRSATLTANTNQHHRSLLAVLLDCFSIYVISKFRLFHRFFQRATCRKIFVKVYTIFITPSIVIDRFYVLIYYSLYVSGSRNHNK
jgi:hypothetical protein